MAAGDGAAGTSGALDGTPGATGAEPPEDPTPATKSRKPPAKTRKGRVKVNTLPWAEVSIDGKSYGRVPVEVSLPVGRHRVVLSNPSMGTRERVVTVTRGGEVSVTRWPN